ncbi:uncharacterized protein LOC129607838 [Condylostylus longicornis]|uniref:uncharacterized protein LOC129607838 n=1 Tax=Condylostylus longicornis TaxID=2530218 RepID=UPI00244D9C1E|nr:uncharacterized protein LOC129607838 [Condylostylus longicornis]
MTQYSILICLIFYFSIEKVLCQEPAIEFSPHISATCKGSTMNIKAEMNMPYTGVIHARDYRTPKCMAYGNGSTSVNLTINLTSKPSLPDFCGVLVSNTNEQQSQERSIQLAVRVHRTLELADDKFYVITCGKAAYSRNSNSQVILKLIKNERRIREAIYGHDYNLRAEILEPKKTNGIRVTNCFAFDKKNFNLTLIDSDGCPVDSIMSSFRPNSDGKTADAYIKSMFKFPDDSEVHLQCDVSSCEESCFQEPNCNNVAIAGVGGAVGTKTTTVKENSDAMLLGATTVFVLDPAENLVSAEICEEGGIRPKWLLWLTIAICVLFLIMLLMNIFLCTAMTCSCARTEIIEKDPSIIEEYDPYRSWHGSQYGSRYSLQARDMANKGYTSGGSTIHSNRSDRF